MTARAADSTPMPHSAAHAPCVAHAPLRVAVVHSGWLPAWAGYVLERIQASSWGELVFVIEDGQPAPRLSEAPTGLLGWYVRADERRFASECRPDALASAREVTLLREVSKATLHDTGAAVDVIVDMRTAVAGKHPALVSRLGCWKLRPCTQPAAAAPPAYRHVLAREPLTPIVLERRDERGRVSVIEEALCRTDDRSVRRNANQACWHGAGLLLRALERAQQGTLDLAVPVARAETREARPLRSGEIATAVGRLVARTLASRIRQGLVRERWGIGFRLHPGQTGPMDADRPPSFITPPPDRTWADPFVIKRGNAHFVFFEELPFATDRGHIAVLELAPSGEWTYLGIALSHDHHLSYPFLFEWQNELFMIPEQSANRRVQLYRCVEFPLHWVPEAVLLDDVRAVDATLHETADGWWMFANVAMDGGATDSECHLFQAKVPTGPWTLHPASPIKRDPRSARPAGRLFERDGRLFRPSQDCSRRYGGAISLNEVTRLDPRGYSERAVGRIDPAWRRDIVAVHTLNGCDGATVVDVLFERLRFAS
jgi:hypothetical protein